MNIYNIIHRLCFSPCSTGWQDLEIKPYKAPTEKIFDSKQEKAEAFAEAAKQVGNTSCIEELVQFILNEDNPSDQPEEREESDSHSGQVDTFFF